MTNFSNKLKVVEKNLPYPPNESKKQLEDFKKSLKEFYETNGTQYVIIID